MNLRFNATSLCWETAFATKIRAIQVRVTEVRRKEVGLNQFRMAEVGAGSLFLVALQPQSVLLEVLLKLLVRDIVKRTFFF